jgi:hypothetical protein
VQRLRGGQTRKASSNDENGVVHSFPMLRSLSRGLCIQILDHRLGRNPS